MEQMRESCKQKFVSATFCRKKNTIEDLQGSRGGGSALAIAIFIVHVAGIQRSASTNVRFRRGQPQQIFRQRRSLRECEYSSRQFAAVEGDHLLLEDIISLGAVLDLPVSTKEDPAQWNFPPGATALVMVCSTLALACVWPYYKELFVHGDPHWLQRLEDVAVRLVKLGACDAKLIPTERDEVVKLHKASLYAPCANLGCNDVETMVKEYQKCSECKQVGYCSRECQVADWKGHKKKCIGTCEQNSMHVLGWTVCSMTTIRSQFGV